MRQQFIRLGSDDPTHATTASAARLHAAAECDDSASLESPDKCWALGTVFEARTIIGSDPRGTGTIDDPGSETWHVREIDARHTPGARADRCLVFENRERVRRLWHYPDNWATLPSHELLALGGVT